MNRRILIIVCITVSMLLSIEDGILLSESFGSEKSCPVQPVSVHSSLQTPCRDTMIGESFEDSFPPIDWDTLSAPGGIQGGEYPIPWNQYGHPYNHTGIFGALYGWGYNLDGWLRIVNLDFTSVEYAELSFWWMSSFEWSVDSNNADLFVEVSTDYGVSWDTLWTFGDSVDVINSNVPWPWGNWEWYQSFLILDAYVGFSAVYIGFHVVGDDNADIAIDDVVIDTFTTTIAEDIVGVSIKDLQFNAATIIIRGEATIELTLPMATEVDLVVYDAMGRLSETLVSQRLSAGTHRLTTHLNLPPGVYFYTLKTSLGKRITKKFLVIE